MGKDYLVNLTKNKEQILYTDEYSNFEYDDRNDDVSFIGLSNHSIDFDN